MITKRLGDFWNIYQIYYIFKRSLIYFLIKWELGELQIYFRKIALHQQKFLVVSVLSNSPWVAENLKKYPK